MDSEGDVVEIIPWYTRSKDERPFSLLRTIYSNSAADSSVDNRAPFYCAAAFPWRTDSLERHLYRESTTDGVDFQADWRDMVKKWTGAVAVGSTGCFHVFRNLGLKGDLTVKIPKPPDWDRTWNVRAIAWAVAPQNPTHPVIIAAIARVLFVFDLHTRHLIGSIRGHGDDIMCIAVHPTEPYQFLTTSKDGSTRIYDLHYNCRQGPNNPPWPPQKSPSLAGPAFGLHACEPEGEGLGRCLAVLVGSRSGGHYGTVFHGAWHPSAHLIATCGMDRSVKIWRIPPIDYSAADENGEHLAREDKPLFSTDLIHKARVLSVTWLTKDVLITHSAPALMRGNTLEDMYETPGTITVWQWLGFARFLPGGAVRQVMRGCKSDYTRSESFKILSEYTLPMENKVTTFAPIIPIKHRPLVLLDDGSDSLRIFDISNFRPRSPPSFPLDEEGNLRTPGYPEVQREPPKPTVHPDQGPSEGSDGVPRPAPGPWEEFDDVPPIVYPRERLPWDLIANVPHWIVRKEDQDTGPVLSTVGPPPERSYFVFGGRMILRISERAFLSLYQLSDS